MKFLTILSCLLFVGKHSFMTKGGQSVNKKQNSVPLIDKIKAVYLYQLGPNNTAINTEYQDYFSNQTARYLSLVFSKTKQICIDICLRQAGVIYGFTKTNK